MKQQVSVVVNSEERSQTMFGPKAETISDLRALFNDCADDGWDGDDACAIDAIALLNAEAFVRALPDGLPLPHVCPDPDGEISLDWTHSRYRIFSLSCGHDDRMAYAWLDGSSSGNGVDCFDGISVPSRITALIQTIVN